MKRILLDTSAFSAFMRGDEDLKGVLQRAEQVVLTPVVLGELKAGFRQGTRPRENQLGLDSFMSSPRVRLAVVDDETSDRYAELVAYLKRTGTPLPTNDIWIAASAIQHGLYLVTTDTHFSHLVQVSVDLHEV